MQMQRLRRLQYADDVPVQLSMNFAGKPIYGPEH